MSFSYCRVVVLSILSLVCPQLLTPNDRAEQIKQARRDSEREREREWVTISNGKEEEEEEEGKHQKKHYSIFLCMHIILTFVLH